LPTVTIADQEERLPQRERRVERELRRLAGFLRDPPRDRRLRLMEGADQEEEGRLEDPREDDNDQEDKDQDAAAQNAGAAQGDDEVQQGEEEDIEEDVMDILQYMQATFTPL
jgi:hypothetical protein